MKFRGLIFAATAAVSVAGLAPAAAAQELVLGYITAKAGTFVSLAKTNEIAAQIAVDEINAAGGVNGKRIRLEKFDSAGNPKQAVVGVRTLARDKNALAIIGPFSSSEARVAFPEGERQKIVTMPMASSAPGLAEPFKFAFRNTSNEGYMFAQVMKTLEMEGIPAANAAIVYVTNDTVSQVLGTRIFPAIFERAGIPVDATVSMQLKAFDLSPQVSQLVSAPTDVVAVGAPPEQAIKLVTEMRRQGHPGRLVGGSTIAAPDLPERMGEAGNLTTLPTTFFAGLNKRTRAFAAEFAKRAAAAGERTLPAQFDAATYDIVLFYAYAMEQAGVTGDADKLEAERAAIRDELAAMKNFPALEGPISFGADGDALKPVYVLEINDGEWKLLQTHGVQN
ncbi:MAG: ABC transporter substrate-binding protein [Gammaproteobacteria bacterium]|nr:ABC transporter substrate-binding protein [Gammaproteobacteria bacterium]